MPCDAKKRGPEERAATLEKLGFTQFAYDYRAEHIPTFDAEMEALKRHHIRLFGLPPARLLLHMKMERAEELLRYGGLRVKEVSEKLGLANPYHFSAAFRRTRGYTPATVRRAAGAPPGA